MRKAIKPILIIFIITIIVVIGIFYANDELNKIGNRISKEVLVNLVEKESKGLYELSFDKIDLDILGRAIRIYNAKLIPNFDNIKDSSKISNLYQVNVDSVDINLRSVLKIYTDNELLVEGVTVVNPQIRMTKINPEKKLLKFGRETGELYETIAEYLDLLKIEYFKVVGGGLKHSPSQLSLSTINFQITDFTIDPRKKKRKVFYSEAINLGLSNQSIDLPDSIHVLTFESFNLSTKDSILSFNNLKIQPRPHINTDQVFNQEEQNIYDILIPTIELKGINYLKAYEDNHLVIDQVNIPEPIINIRSASDADSTKNISDNTIGKSLLALFDLVKVSKLEINKGALDLIVKAKNQQQFKSENISIALFNIMLDSNNYQINSRTTYFENAKIQIHDYNYKLPDSLHVISFNTLSINTINSSLEVKDFVITPSRNTQNENITHYSFDIPIINLEGIDYKQALIDKQMFLKNMYFESPAIIINPANKKENSGTEIAITPQVLQGFLKSFFEEVRAGQIEVNNGKVEVSNQFLIDGISLNLQGLRIDTASSSWHNLADSISLYANTLTLNRKDQLLNIDKIKAGKQLHSFELGSLYFKDNKTGNSVRTSELHISGVQLDSMIKSKIVQVEELVVSAPHIEINKKFTQGKTSATGWKLPENPILLTLNNGSLKYATAASGKVSVERFNTKISYLDKISLDYLHAGKIKVDLPDLAHSITADSLLLPEKGQRLSVRRITARSTTDKNKLKITAEIPLLQFIAFQKKTLLTTGKLVADSLKLTASSLDIQWLEESMNKVTKKSNSNKENEKNDNLDFSVQLNTIQLKINNSSIAITNDINERSHWNQENTILTLTDFSLPSTTKKELLYSNGQLLEFAKLTGKLSNGDSLAVGKSFYSTITGKGKFNQVNYSDKSRNTRAKIAQLELENWDFQKLTNQNELNIGKILSKSLTVNLTLNKSDTNRSFHNQQFLPFHQLTINQFSAEDMNLELYHAKNERYYHIRKAALSIHKLRLDSAFNLKNLHHKVQSFSFSGKDFKEDLGKNYSVSAKSYTFSYPDAGLTIADFAVRNRYERFEFNKHIDFQTDWFDLNLASIRLSGINLDKLMNETFEVQKIALNGGKFTIFRDLNVPLDSTKYVPLPQELLRKVKHPVFIDSISVSTDIDIYIVPAHGTGLGYVSFRDLKGGIKNITTRPGANPNSMKLSAKGLLNGLGEFQAKVDFPFKPGESIFNMKGSVGNVELATLNNMLIPIAAVEVRSGTNNSLTFNFSGNNDYSKGGMSFQYENLKVNILDRETYQSTGLNNNLRTFFANSFVVRGQNPNLFKLHEGDIFYKRDKSRSIFNFWAKSLLSGAVSSIGISNNEEAKEYEQIESGSKN